MVSDKLRGGPYGGGPLYKNYQRGGLSFLRVRDHPLIFDILGVVSGGGPWPCNLLKL